MKPRDSLLQFWPILVIIAVWLAIVVANYIPGTWLMGWDNVMPEFNFRQALATNIFGVWQEHRGLGLYDGMGHAANLVHTIFLWLLSLALPTSILRYTFHFLMHLTGGIGAYALIKKLINQKWIALAGALFYQYNLGTIQMFYAPLEAFSVHFASLPWLAWSLTAYLREGSRKTFLTFLLISFLSTPQFFIPTLLFPVALLLISISITTSNTIKRVGGAAVGFLLINAFWLLPYLYGLPRNAPVIQAAKINQMSSEEVFARNQAFGGLGNVLRLRGFPLDFEDTDEAGATTFLMAPWREFLNHPLVTIASWLLVGITVLGIGMNGFLLPFAASMLFLANDTPIIKNIIIAIRDGAPVLAEAYRFPFTKLSLLFALSSSVFFAFGLTRIVKVRILPIIVSATIIVLTLPAFRGHFFSDRLRLRLPDAYQRLFAFMGSQPMGRTAYLPQHQYWSWKYYRWGYRGSGFLWYGLSQPLLDRAFDPWSRYNENYYWEISRSIYSKDAQSLRAVFRKYDVRSILLDENLISPSHNRALFTEEMKAMLASLPEIRETARFGKLTVYERTGASQSSVSLSPSLPLVSPAYQWTDNDVAYRELGDYINQSGGYTYPFRSLFTKRSVDEREFDVKEVLTRIDALVYDSTKSADLIPEHVKPCGPLQEPTSEVRASFTSEVNPSLRFTSRGGRGCLSFALTNQAGPDTGLPHSEGYLVAVESRHISGRPLLFSLINQTAKHVELETYLQGQTDYFILPPLATDGLGYSAYVANDAIGRQETVNDLRTIRVYTIPYDALVHLHSQPQGPALSVNPTLVFSQAYDPGWTAWERIPMFPYVRKLNDHVLVNNWANGWRLPSAGISNHQIIQSSNNPIENKTIILFFWPQLLQWLGFALLPLPLLFVFFKKPHSRNVHHTLAP